ncbi:lytic transglycosylase domain-containing protein [Actinomadura flavalba]|uniref:aggregation-promoting factor C-terminal-like domain-containing protein n=1 Tax=Actinomadura flavalba TaxID=1120938 RepID=UPI0012DDB2D2
MTRPANRRALGPLGAAVLLAATLPAPAASASAEPGAPAAGERTDRNKRIARTAMRAYGWGSERQFRCLERLWERESGWNENAHNSSSGAHGIPQALPGSKMAAAGSNWRSNARTQILWGLKYIKGRHGTPCGAWSHFQSKGWY